MAQTKKAKTKKARKARKVTLKRVQNKAIANPKFWKSLRQDAQRALRENGWRLGAADARQLEALLALDGKAVAVDLHRLMKRARMTSHLHPGTFPGVSWISFWIAPFPGGPKVPR